MRLFISLVQQRREATKRDGNENETEHKNEGADQARRHPKNLNWTTLATCVIAVATIVSGVIAWAQWRTLGRQTAVIAADQRAWVSYKITGFEDFTFDEQGRARFPVTIAIRNTGHSVAQAITAQVRMFPNPLEDGPKTFVTAVQERDRLCATLAAAYATDDPPSESFVLFPDDGETGTTSLSMTKGEMDAAKIVPSGQESPYIDPMIVGCAVYRLAFERRLHKTAFVRSVAIRPPIDPQHSYLIKVGRFVPAATISLVPFFFAADLAD